MMREILESYLLTDRAREDLTDEGAFELSPAGYSVNCPTKGNRTSMSEER